MALGELKNGIGPDAYAIYQQVLAAVVERDHPIGSLYISENATSPAELYGGTWERIEGRFIMGASNTYPAGSTGGEAKHQITVAEMPTHEHFYRADGGGGIPQIAFSAWSWGFDVKTITQNTEDKTTLGAAIGKAGSNEPHNNIPPYYSMYIWRRVA